MESGVKQGMAFGHSTNVNDPTKGEKSMYEPSGLRLRLNPQLLMVGVPAVLAAFSVGVIMVIALTI